MTERFVKNSLNFGILIFGLLVTSCSYAQVQNENAELVTAQNRYQVKCEMTPEQKDALLKLDYKSFDQTLPDGGWRKYQACEELTRDLVDAYTQKHFATLEKQQRDVLIWHSGQLSGFLGDYPRAIASMEQTFRDTEKSTDAFLWNPYAKATIAFLKKDKPALLSERKKLARGSSPYNHMNLRKVDALVRCFESSYQAAYSDACEPKETNVEKIRSLAIEFDFKKPLPMEPMGLLDILRQKKVILVGEIHGTNEVPELFGNLVSSVANSATKTLVALEINQSSQSAIDAFLKTGDEDILKKDVFFHREYQDGRSSKAMVDLLKRLSKLPNTTVLCMDPMATNPPMSGQERDTAMAAFISSKVNGYQNALVLSGNIHSAVEIGTPWDPKYRPMGYELKNMLKGMNPDQMLSILVRHEQVGSWNCQGNSPSECSARYGEKLPTEYSTAVSWNSYFMLENAFVGVNLGTIFIRKTTVSFPFVKSPL
jgi:hypothetical protein